MIPASRRRLVVLYVVLGALLAGLGARAWFLQVGSRASYAALANQDRIRDIVQPPVRGEHHAGRGHGRDGDGEPGHRAAGIDEQAQRSLPRAPGPGHQHVRRRRPGA